MVGCRARDVSQIMEGQLAALSVLLQQWIITVCPLWALQADTPQSVQHLNTDMERCAACCTV